MCHGLIPTTIKRKKTMPRPNTRISPIHTRDDGTRAREIYSEYGNKKYRYLLELIWSDDLNLPILMFVMSRPSSATLMDNNDDRAVTTCENRARNHHILNDNNLDVDRLPFCFGRQQFRGVCVTNIFSFLETEENSLADDDDPFYKENCKIIKQYAKRQDTTVVCAWGNQRNQHNQPIHPRLSNRRNRIKNKLRRTGVTLNYFGLNPVGQQPRHVNRFDPTVDFDIWPRKPWWLRLVEFCKENILGVNNQ